MSEHSVNVITGLSGVGKGTVLEEVMKLANKNYLHVNYGDKMMEVAEEKDVEKGRDELKELKPEKYREIQLEAAQQIKENSKEKNVIIETHSALKSSAGYVPGIPNHVAKKLQPNKIIMLNAPAETIYNRSNNSKRDRDTTGESIDSLEEYREVSMRMACTVSVLTDSYFKVIENKSGEAEKAAEKVLKTLRA